MKTLGLLIALVFLSSYSFATFGSWTLYYTDNPYADANGNLWLGSPTVGITGNDGGSYCVAEDGCNGIEQAWVLLAGNVWESGPIYYAVNSPTVSASYTWPDIEITGPTDVSYAGKVEGAIQLSGHEGWTERTGPHFTMMPSSRKRVLTPRHHASWEVVFCHSGHHSQTLQEAGGNPISTASRCLLESRRRTGDHR